MFIIGYFLLKFKIINILTQITKNVHLSIKSYVNVQTK